MLDKLGTGQANSHYLSVLAKTQNKKWNKANLREVLYEMADGVGFEPTLGFRPKHTFQACAFNHSAIHPLNGFLYILLF